MKKLRVKSVTVVPWGSWKEWDSVRDALFSSSPSQISLALDRITAWQIRGNVPIAVEITARIVSIYQRDACILPTIPGESVLPDEMLRMMYAMSIMRLINGIVEDPRIFTIHSGSLANRAETLELPHLLVDIRHETAHNELPSIQLLRIAAKQALAWLHMFYWQQQKESLEASRQALKENILEYFNLVLQQKNSHTLNEVFRTIARISRYAVDEVVSVLLDDGILENSSAVDVMEGGDDDDVKLTSVEDVAWKRTLWKLRKNIPQFPQLLLLGIVRRLVYIDGDGREMMSVQKNEVNREKLLDWMEWILEGEKSGNEENLYSQKKGAKSQRYVVREGEICGELKRQMMVLCLKRRSELRKDLYVRLVKALCVEDDGDGEYAVRLAKMSATAAEMTHALPHASPQRQPQEDLQALECSVEEVKVKQQQLLMMLMKEKKEKKNGSKRKRSGWMSAENWHPCGIGMLPSPCHYGGVRPTWLHGLSTEGAKPSCRTIDVDRTVDDANRTVDETKGTESGDKAAECTDEVKCVKFEDDVDEMKKIGKSVKGCLFLNGSFQAVGAEVLNSLQKQIVRIFV